MRRKPKTSFTSEEKINLTPATDCVFNLLIFFMLATVFVDINGLVVDLPMGGAAESEQKEKKDVNIAVSATGEYTVEGKIVSEQELPDAIQKSMDANNNRNVIIQGDPATEQRYIVYVMDMAQGQGAEGMAFAVVETQ